MATTSDFRNGMCIEMENDLFQIIHFQHVKPGKGGAFVRTKLKSINTGRVLEKTFNAGEKIKTARVEKRPFQYLYEEGETLVFMNQETFEQVSISKDLVDTPEFLKEGEEVNILYHAETETPLSCELPQFVELEVTYTEPGIKGDTATNTLKSATLETGTQVQVPLFINTGEVIKIDTRSKNYVERVKNK
jgi:elongation factor P